MKKKYPDPTGAELCPGDPHRCQGNGADAEYECCCDECDYYLDCYPDAMPVDHPMQKSEGIRLPSVFIENDRRMVLTFDEVMMLKVGDRLLYTARRPSRLEGVMEEAYYVKVVDVGTEVRDGHRIREVKFAYCQLEGSIFCVSILADDPHDPRNSRALARMRRNLPGI